MSRRLGCGEMSYQVGHSNVSAITNNDDLQRELAYDSGPN